MLKIIEVARATFLVYFFRGKSYVLILTKIGWATFWATFKKKSLGHPGSNLDIQVTDRQNVDKTTEKFSS
jgi:hypothetical protein